MIEIISHRGFWSETIKQNSRESFIHSLQRGYGIETDIRDYKGELVIAHDIPKATNKQFYVDDFFSIYKKYGKNETLALNIKSDGLSKPLKEKLFKYDINNYFVFDMSVPDMLQYHKQDLIFFTRHSDVEPIPCLLKESSGVWLDEFFSNWITEEVLKNYHKEKKRVCIVSPELHGRDFQNEWVKYKHIFQNNPQIKLIMCTDYPDKARTFFEQN